MDNYEKEKQGLLAFFDGKVFNVFVDELNERKNIINEQLKKLKVENDKNEILFNLSKLQLITQKGQIDKKTEEIDKLKQEKKYRAIEDFFVNNFNVSVDISILEKNIKDTLDKITEIEAKNKECQKEIETKKDILKLTDIDNIEEQISSAESRKLQDQQCLYAYEQIVLSACNIELNNIEKEKAEDLFEIKRKENLSKKENLETLLKHYKIIDSLKEQTLSYLVAEKTKTEISDLSKQLKRKEKLDAGLKKEKENLQLYLKEKIDNFFYTDLINKIYQKIDPHPDYEEIEFDCDFNGINPRLQIYTKDKFGNLSVPALYFSSAQINILSLSIFLARALKANNPETGEPIKCIFIDDPIQSMDSINILSFIDLFRSIVKNLDRQIIVSTHEENFHLLLQKKIPEEYFNSKFISFETFGKLKM